MTAPPDDRRYPPEIGDERATLAGLPRLPPGHADVEVRRPDAEQLRARPLPTTNLSLLGLVRHLADVERSWFRRRLAGEDAPPIFYTEAEPDLDIDPPPDADPEADIAVWRAEVAACDAAVAGRDLDDTFASPDGDAVAALALRAT